MHFESAGEYRELFYIRNPLFSDENAFSSAWLGIEFVTTSISVEMVC